MSWKVRHEGAPTAVERSPEQVGHELADGVWETTDEVLEPGSSGWVPLESHPRFADLCEELETPPKPAAPDEAHLDMNALIDVTMVLLIFFILTTTVAAMQRRIDAPTVSEGKLGIPVISKEKAEATTIQVVAKVENGETVVLVDGAKVELKTLAGELKKRVTPQKTSVLLSHDDFVSQDMVVQILDATKAAQLSKVHLVVPEPPAKKK